MLLALHNDCMMYFGKVESTQEGRVAVDWVSSIFLFFFHGNSCMHVTL